MGFIISGGAVAPETMPFTRAGDRGQAAASTS